MVISPIQNYVSTVLSGTQASASSAVTSTSAVSVVQAESGVSVSTSTPSSLLAYSNLQTASVGLAQLSSLLTEAQSGTQQVGSVLQKLQTLAGEAQAGGPPSALASLNSLFQELLSQINQLATSTSFGGENLLDGSQSTQGTESSASGASSLSLPDLTTQGLFGSATLNISTVDGANTASAAIATALGSVNTSNGNIGQTLAEVNYTSANVDTALANNTASTSVLTESDLTNVSEQDALSSFLGSPAAAATAQTTNLPPTLLSLLQE